MVLSGNRARGSSKGGVARINMQKPILRIMRKRFSLFSALCGISVQKIAGFFKSYIESLYLAITTSKIER